MRSGASRAQCGRDMRVAVNRARQRSSRASSANSRSGDGGDRVRGCAHRRDPAAPAGGSDERCARTPIVAGCAPGWSSVPRCLRRWSGRSCSRRSWCCCSPRRSTPAYAHAGGLTSAPSEARVLAVEPPVTGLDVQAVEFGARLRIGNGTAVPVVVEPLPGSALSGLPTVAPGARAWWSDPRITAAAAHARPPGDRLDWAVPLQVGDETVAVRRRAVLAPATACRAVVGRRAGGARRPAGGRNPGRRPAVGRRRAGRRDGRGRGRAPAARRRLRPGPARIERSPRCCSAPPAMR